MTQTMPSVVILGRPNVGKSTLFNRLTGTRRSIVTDEPGITRDRLYGTVRWGDSTFEVVDTGGLLPGDKASLPQEILRQAQVAIAAATQLILVVDARAGVTALDVELACLLRQTGKPLVIAANKVDTQQQEPLAAPFYRLSDRVYPLSAEHGLGVDLLLDELTRGLALDASNQSEAGSDENLIQVAIIGRPNVGKSTLLNQLVGSERAIVSSEPGTTRDAVDTVVRRADHTYRFIDTAGMRRKGRTKLIAEKLSVVMARKNLERADVALLVADAAQGITSGDATIAGYAQQSGRSLIIVLNKWDLALEAAAKNEQRQHGSTAGGRARSARSARMDPERLMVVYEPLVRARLKFLDYAPIIFLSALTGERTAKLFRLIDRIAAARRRRISTSELNRWLAQVDLGRGSSPAGRRIKIYYITQASVSPPTFVLFSNQTRRLHFSYERFLENQLRSSFDFTGTPIRFLQRLKQKRPRKAP